MSSVSIVGITQPLIKTNSNPNLLGLFDTRRNLTTDEFIAYIARVSNPKNQTNVDTAEKLVKYLLNHKHFSPFEMVNVVLEINTTRDIGRQILRHRSFSFQEFSQRYADPTSSLGFETKETRLQDTKNRQNSLTNSNADLARDWEVKQHQINHECQLAYKWAVENGIAKEVARTVLPEGNTQSRMYMNGTLRSWIHFISVRYHPDAQKEVREIARMAYEQIIVYFPTLKDYMELIITENFRNHGDI